MENGHFINIKEELCNIMNLIDDLEERICAVTLVIMLVLTFVNVLSRYFFHYSISFTEEITTNLFVLVSTMGAAVAVKRGSHLGLSLISDSLPSKSKAILAGITNILSGIFGIVLLYTGSQMVYNQKIINARSISLQWPTWIYGLALPVGTFFIVFRFGQQAYIAFKDASQFSNEIEPRGDS